MQFTRKRMKTYTHAHPHMIHPRAHPHTRTNPRLYHVLYEDDDEEAVNCRKLPHPQPTEIHSEPTGKPLPHTVNFGGLEVWENSFGLVYRSGR